MATWTYRRSSLTAADASVLASRPTLLFRKNGPIVFTKIHTGPLGGVTHVDLRLPDGEFVAEVAIEYFLADCGS